MLIKRNPGTMPSRVVLPLFRVIPDTYTFEYEANGVTGYISILNWSISINTISSWLTVTGMGTNDITLTVTENSSDQTRSGVVVLRENDNDRIAEITVTQYPDSSEPPVSPKWDIRFYGKLESSQFGVSGTNRYKYKYEYTRPAVDLLVNTLLKNTLLCYYDDAAEYNAKFKYERYNKRRLFQHSANSGGGDSSVIHNDISKLYAIYFNDEAAARAYSSVGGIAAPWPDGYLGPETHYYPGDSLSERIIDQLIPDLISYKSYLDTKTAHQYKAIIANIYTGMSIRWYKFYALAGGHPLGWYSVSTAWINLIKHIFGLYPIEDGEKSIVDTVVEPTAGNNLQEYSDLIKCIPILPGLDIYSSSSDIREHAAIYYESLMRIFRQQNAPWTTNGIVVLVKDGHGNPCNFYQVNLSINVDGHWINTGHNVNTGVFGSATFNDIVHGVGPGNEYRVMSAGVFEVVTPNIGEASIVEIIV